MSVKVEKTEFPPCLAGQRDSLRPCGGVFRTFKDLDDEELVGKVRKVSWIVLSRLGLNFLNGERDSEVLCEEHFMEYYRDWAPEEGCSLAQHISPEKIEIGECTTSLVMSVKILQTEARVIPIGGRVCDNCKSTYDAQYAPKPGERVLIILKKRKSPPENLESVCKEEVPPPPEKKNKLDEEEALDPLADVEESSVKEPCKYFCKLCKIPFLKESSYKYHKKTNLELHNRIKTRIRKEREEDDPNGDWWECSDCYIAFSDRVARQKHFAEVHFTMDHPFHCKSCNVILKNESSYKSHNSKLHVERMERSYYCRECDETFACKLIHARHILIHRPWNGDIDALQCKICGKVFTRNQNQAFRKHLDTHDTVVNDECQCLDCFNYETWEEEDSMTEEEEEEDNSEDDVGVVGIPDMARPFQCNLCPMKFSDPKDLEEHVSDGAHQILKHSGDSSKPPYPDVKPSGKSADYKNSRFNKDLFKRMKLSFQALQKETSNDEDDCSDDGDTDYVNLRPKSRALNASFQQSRRRMEALLKRAREFVRKGSSTPDSPPSSPISDHFVSDDEDDFSSGSDLDEDDDSSENLLIPIENGWVCEKRWEKDSKCYSTHFWSPDGLRHSSLAVIQFYGEKKNLNLDMSIFHREVANNPPPPI